jgi:hypothetical protein
MRHNQDHDSQRDVARALGQMNTPDLTKRWSEPPPDVHLHFR